MLCPHILGSEVYYGRLDERLNALPRVLQDSLNPILTCSFTHPGHNLSAGRTESESLFRSRLAVFGM